MSTNAFIINPAAGSGRTQRRLKSLVKEIKTHDGNARILITRHALHAIDLSKSALLDGFQRLVVIGGDGTLNEVVNGYFDKDGRPLNDQASIAIIPSGTGSDFVRSIQHEEDLGKSIEFAITKEAKLTDVGQVDAHDANGIPIKRYFINVSSLGLSGMVAGFMKTVTKKLGARSAYFIATLQAIRAFRAPTLLLSDEDGEKTLNSCSLVSFANGKFFGSGMQIAPDAQLDDGKLEVVTIQDLGPLFFLLNGYRVYQGTHGSLENVHIYRKQECSIKAVTKEPVYIETDGELFGQLPAKYVVNHNAIRVVR